MFTTFDSKLLGSIMLALVVDQILGEPRRFHPLVGFGYLATRLENKLNRPSKLKPVLVADTALSERSPFDLPDWLRSIFTSTITRREKGLLALLCMIGVPLLCMLSLQSALTDVPLSVAIVVDALVLYLAIGRQSLVAHARAVAKALQRNDIVVARRAVAKIVTRDTTRLDATAVSAATVETVLENGSDAIFASLFWFIVAGIPGVVLHRTANTLDAMWGYRNERFNEFGWAAARFDDALNYIPARLTALTYALSGRVRRALRCWRKQAPLWSSPNAGPVMAAGAGALNIKLGGAALYNGILEQRSILGEGPAAQPADIDRALGLLDRSLLIWLFVLLIIASAARWLF